MNIARAAICSATAGIGLAGGVAIAESMRSRPADKRKSPIPIVANFAVFPLVIGGAGFLLRPHLNPVMQTYVAALTALGVGFIAGPLIDGGVRENVGRTAALTAGAVGAVYVGGKGLFKVEPVIRQAVQARHDRHSRHRP